MIRFSLQKLNAMAITHRYLWYFLAFSVLILLVDEKRPNSLLFFQDDLVTKHTVENTGIDPILHVLLLSVQTQK